MPAANPNPRLSLQPLQESLKHVCPAPSCHHPRHVCTAGENFSMRLVLANHRISYSPRPPLSTPSRREMRGNPGEAQKAAGTGRNFRTKADADCEKRNLSYGLVCRMYPDGGTGPVGNALMRSEIQRFVPVLTALRAHGFYLLLTVDVPRSGGERKNPTVFARKYSVFPDFKI